jgi:predicted ATPase/DNA-binding CsgD family transcriptional regulator
LLGERALLLVLDNFEHLEAAAPVVTDLLAVCSRLKILVTSRVALRLSGERAWLVPPLALPDEHWAPSPDEAKQSDAVRLFLQRARAVQPGIRPNAETLAAVARICRHLDGLPLAIELAAARISHLSPAALLAWLDRAASPRLALLTGGPRDQPARLRTLRDTIAWSYDLLDEAEQTFFQDLSVFPGSFTLEAAERVSGVGARGSEESRGAEESSRRCDPSPSTDARSPAPDTLDTLASLVAKSLVGYEGEPGDQPRYGMLETIREFGRERLTASGRESAVRQRHVEWALALAERAGPQAKGPQAAVWVDALERDHASLRAALAWLVEREDGKRLARLAAALWPFWEEHAHYAEGRQWLETALALGGVAPANDRLQLLAGAGTMAWQQTDFAQAILHHEQALTLAREIGDREAEAFALNNLGVQAKEFGNFDEARSRYDACIAIAREAGMTQLMIRTLHNRAQILRVQGDSAAAMHSMEEVLTLAREHSMHWPLPAMLAGLGLTAMDLGDYERANALFHEGLALAVARGNLGNVIDVIESMAKLATVTGQPEQALRLFGAAEALREELVFPLSPADLAARELIRQALRETVGTACFTATWASGRALSQEEALAEALALRVDLAPATTPSAEHPVAVHGLSERELEVLRLLATGHTNRQVGEALFISPLTAARHIANIYTKLGVDSRAEATAFAHKHGLA